MSLSPEELRFIAEYTASVIGKINQVLANRITTTFTNSNDVIPSSKLVKDEFAAVRSEIPTNTSDLTNDGADGTNAFIVEGDSRLTDTRNPKSHNQASSTITDTNTYSNIGNTLQNQASINAAVNEKIGALMNLDFIEQVTTRPTASADTLNKIYAVPETTGETEDLFEIFITVYENNAYKWEKLDTARIDISGKVDKVQGKQLSTEDYTTAEKTKLNNIEAEANKTIVDSTFINNSTNPIQSNVIQTSLNSKVNTSDLAAVATSGNYNDLSNKPNVVEKSVTSGLIKNDGTIDTNQYITEDNIPESFNYGYVDSNLILHLICVDGEVTATNSIIQSGDPNTLTAVITDKENHPLEGMPVEFLINGVKYGQTVNSNAYGIATCSYVGTGAGEISVQVRVGSFLSETYSLIDAIFHDGGTSSDHNSNWVYSRNTITHNVTSDYTELIDNDSSSFSICAIDPQNSKTMRGCMCFNQSICVEFEFVEYSNVGYRFYDYTSSGLVDRSFDNSKQAKLIKLEAKDNKIYLYYDGELQANPVNFNPTDKFYFGFNIRNTSICKFKNLRVYPI